MNVNVILLFLLQFGLLGASLGEATCLERVTLELYQMVRQLFRVQRGICYYGARVQAKLIACCLFSRAT